MSPRAVRGLLALLTLATTSPAVLTYHAVARRASVNVFEWLALPLFAILFAWLAFSFWNATLGLWFCLGERRGRQSPGEDDDQSPSLPATAILVPIYNENPARVFASIKAMAASLAATPHAGAFEFVVLSDTTDPDIWLEEEHAWRLLTESSDCESSVYYRRRPFNVARKSGNIVDFCERWGANYRYMIVLDADSLMEGATLVEMTRRMEADPRLGILQAPPTPINRHSVLARLQQFSARMYGAVFVRGFSALAGDVANYWGHNAILRIEPFINHCGLPVLPGRAPLGGEILSHDFVEAALMSRSGWKVRVAHDLRGSHEESPTTLADYAKRDQRWCQGNMQHTRLILREGFHPISRFHLACGAWSYLASPVWMLFMGFTLAATIVDGVAASFGEETLPLTATLFAVSFALLLVPKLWGLLASSRDREDWKASGGTLPIIASSFLETMISVLTAPIMAVYHTLFVVQIMRGKTVRWTSQNRDEGKIDFMAAFRQYAPHMAAAALLGWLVAALEPSLLLWFSPILAGLALAPLVSLTLDSGRLGQFLARRNLLLIPEEKSPSPTLVAQREAIDWLESELGVYDRDERFAAVLRDPSFHALHIGILDATDSHVDSPPDEADRAMALLRRHGPAGVPPALRRAILSDSRLLRQLHVWTRCRDMETAESRRA